MNQTTETPASIFIVDELPDNLRRLADILRQRGCLVRMLRESPHVMPSVLNAARMQRETGVSRCI